MGGDVATWLIDRWRYLRWRAIVQWDQFTYWQDQFPTWAAVLLGLAAIGVLCWAWWGEAIGLAALGRAFWRVPRRCPKCRYDMSGAGEASQAGLRCPECGRVARTERELRKRRRRPFLACLCLLVLAACVFQVGWRRWGNGRWILLQPVDWVIANAPTMDEWQTAPYPYWYHHVLIDRSLRGDFTDAQWRAALRNTGYAVARPRAHASDPVAIDLAEVYWMSFFTVDVRAVDDPAAAASTGVTGYTPLVAGSRTVINAGGNVLTCPPPPPGQPVVLHLTIYASSEAVRHHVAWEGTLEVAAPVEGMSPAFGAPGEEEGQGP